MPLSEPSAIHHGIFRDRKVARVLLTVIDVQNDCDVIKGSPCFVLPMLNHAESLSDQRLPQAFTSSCLPVATSDPPEKVGARANGPLSDV